MLSLLGYIPLVAKLFSLAQKSQNNGVIQNCSLVQYLVEKYLSESPQTMAVALMNEWIVLTLIFAYQLHSNFSYVIIKNNIHAGDCSSSWRGKFKVNFLVTSQELKTCQIIDILLFQFTCSRPGDMTLVRATWGRSSLGFQFSLRLKRY